MTVLILVVGGMVAAVLLVGVGDRLRLPWPALMVVVGGAAAFVPGIEAPDIDPELILPLFLPPLLFATAQRASWALFRTRWRTIALLAVGLVLATIAAVAGTVVWLVPGLATSAALAVGAAVAPPDPVAVEAVAGPLRIPRRLVATLQSEGLFNDATALVVFQAAVAATVSGTSTGAVLALGFVYGAVAAVVVGLVAASVVRAVISRLTDEVAPSALTLVLPFGVYLAADAIGASGVIAVVVAALQMRQSSEADDSRRRLTDGAFWDVVEMLVTAVAFALIGLELREVVLGAGDGLGRMLAHAGIVCAVVLIVRAVWMAASLLVVRRRLARAGPGTRGTSLGSAAPRTAREAVVLTWSGMRGLATLALALALPLTTDDGVTPFPGRAELTVIAAAVIVVTLLGPGFTLPLLLRLLGVRASEEAEQEAERRLAGRARQAALTELAALDREAIGVDDAVGEEVLGELRARFARLGTTLAGDDTTAVPAAVGDEVAEDYRDRLAALARRRDQWGRLQAVALAAARREVLAARAEPGTDPELADRVLQRLDVRTLALARP